MRHIAICGHPGTELKQSPNFIDNLTMNGVEIYCGVIHTEDAAFDPEAEENQEKVLVKKRAFSCNYRDKALIFQAALKAPEDRFYTIGSEFVGEVVAVGSKVTALQVRDRVIANGSYPQPVDPHLHPGLPTNNGSREYQILHHKQLIKIPPEMSDEVAAAFTIGAQTVYSMLRKLDIQPGTNVLVTAAKSNTSLFAIHALQNYDVNVYATSTSLQFAEEFQKRGVKQLIQVDPNQENWLANNQELANIFRQTGGFDYIIDPFFDLHIGKVIFLFPRQRGGKYVTCGLYDQYASFIGEDFQYKGGKVREILTFMVLNNIQLIGNCLGSTQDLSQAIQDYANGKLQVAIDSVFSDNQVQPFFDRTYNAKDRFGKVVYKFTDASS